MKIKYSAIVFALFSVLILLILNSTQVNTVISKTKMGATPTPAKMKKKTGCTMPTLSSSPATIPTPSPSLTPTPEPIVGTSVVREREMSGAFDAMKLSDADCDGISDYYDNCKEVHNSKQEDKNKNGIGDACEKKKRGIKGKTKNKT